MAADLFYQNGGQQSGPVDSRELRRLAEAGIVKPDTLVRVGTSNPWVRAERVHGLFQRSTPAPSPSLGAPPPVPPPLPSPSGETNVPTDLTPARNTNGDESPLGLLEERRALQGALVYAFVGCLGLVGLFLLGIVLDATGVLRQSKPLEIVAKPLEIVAKAVCLVALFSLCNAARALLVTPWATTKEALRDREFWRLRTRTSNSVTRQPQP